MQCPAPVDFAVVKWTRGLCSCVGIPILISAANGPVDACHYRLCFGGYVAVSAMSI